MKRYEDVKPLCEYIAENHSDSDLAIKARASVAGADILLGNDAAAQAGVDALIRDFAEDPELAGMLWKLGNISCEGGKYDRAAELYQYVIDNWPKTEHEMRAKTGIAKLNISLGNDANAQAAIDSLIADFNDHPALPEAIFQVGHGYYTKARLKEKDGLDDKAKEYYRKAITVWEKIINKLPPSATTPQAYYCSAVCYSQELGEYQKGIDYYQQIVDNWPHYQYAWHAQFFVGKYYEKLRNSGSIPDSEANPKIEQAYQAVIEKYPDSKSTPSAALYLGRINFNRKQWVEAAYYFELFLQKSDNNQSLRYVVSPLGQAYEKMGEADSAIAVYREFIATAEPADRLVQTIAARLEKLEGVEK